MQRKNFTRPIFITAGALLIPLVAMQFTREFAWGPGDFVIAGLLVCSTSVLYELATFYVKKPRQRIVVAIVLAAVLLVVWAQLAVGVM